MTLWCSHIGTRLPSAGSSAKHHPSPSRGGEGAGIQLWAELLLCLVEEGVGWEGMRNGGTVKSEGGRGGR